VSDLQLLNKKSMFNLNFYVLHELPGRCRLRVHSINADHLNHLDLERRLKACIYIKSFRINRSSQSVVVQYQGSIEILLSSLLTPITINLTPKLKTSFSTLKIVSSLSNPQPLRSLALSSAALMLGPSAGAVISMGLIVLSGLPIWKRALSTLVFERRLNVDFLDGLALAIAVFRQQPRTAALMTLMVHLGDVVREKTAGQSRRHIRDLLELHTVVARRLEHDGSITIVAAQDLEPNQSVLLLAGDQVPADGRVTMGVAAIDQRHITGESIPATRRIGDIVYAGSCVTDGTINFLVTESGADTLASKIVELVESAPVGETRIQNYAEQFADHLVAPVLGLNLAMLAATGNVDRFLSLAIVDYGTGIRVAAPTSILASMTRAARNGILIKSGRHVEHLATMKGIAFDKTGTLTCGLLTVLEVKSFVSSVSTDTVLQLAASAETELRHPVARALVWHARTQRGLDLPLCDNVQFVIGLGVEAEIAGHRIHVGSERFLKQMNISTHKAQAYMFELEKLGHIGLLIALDDQLIGAISCSDEPRAEAKSILAGLRLRGVNNIVMLSGDRAGVAKRIAQSIGISKVYSEVLPHEKAQIIRELREANGPFAMVGDGVNDSPALAQADVGISLVDGADIARTAADVVLMKEGLHLLLPAIDISRDALHLVKQNYAIIASCNTLALALAIPTGLISPAACTLLSNGSALLATMNAMRPLLPQKQATAQLN